MERSREPGDPQVKPEMTEGLGAHPQTLGLADFYPISKLDSIITLKEQGFVTNTLSQSHSFLLVCTFEKHSTNPNVFFKVHKDFHMQIFTGCC